MTTYAGTHWDEDNIDWDQEFMLEAAMDALDRTMKSTQDDLLRGDIDYIFKVLNGEDAGEAWRTLDDHIVGNLIGDDYRAVKEFTEALGETMGVR